MRDELNEWETANMLAGEEWAFSRLHGDVLSVDFLKRLHARMFNQTWDWAGQFRRSEKNLGMHWEQIPEASRNLFDDIKYWLENETFDDKEIAMRLHHRLTVIHPFPNGNGRLARLLTDVFLVSRSHDRFTWGREDLAREGDVRARYVAALRAADEGDLGPLREFLTAQGPPVA
jgi:Fic-DOC domain mobile mystery protein B